MNDLEKMAREKFTIKKQGELSYLLLMHGELVDEFVYEGDAQETIDFWVHEFVAFAHVEAQRWIPVSDERKPLVKREDDYLSEEVLLLIPEWEHPVVLGHYLPNYGQFRPNGSHGCEKYVTAWQPLPLPPPPEVRS